MATDKLKLWREIKTVQIKPGDCDRYEAKPDKDYDAIGCYLRTYDDRSTCILLLVDIEGGLKEVLPTSIIKLKKPDNQDGLR